MTVQVSQSILAKKLQQKSIDEASKHAKDPINFGLQRLPGGIMNGVAKLVECGFFEVKAGSDAKKFDGSSAVGEVLFRAAGVVMYPETVPLPDGSLARVAGLQTSVIVPMYDSKRSGKLASQGDNVQRAMNEMKLLADNADFFDKFGRRDAKGNLVVDADALESAAAVLRVRCSNNARPLYFRFTTEQGKKTAAYPDPMTFENWRGSRGLKDWSPEPIAGKIQDSNVASSNGTTNYAAAVAEASHAVPAQQAAEPTQAEMEAQPAAADDIAVLIAQSNGDPAERETALAQNRLKELAIANGYTEDQTDATNSWEELADLCRPKAAEPAAAVKDSGPVGPAKGEMWKYNRVPFIDQKTKKQVYGKDGQPKFRAVDCEVTAVNADGSYDLIEYHERKQAYKAANASELEPA